MCTRSTLLRAHTQTHTQTHIHTHTHTHIHTPTHIQANPGADANGSLEFAAQPNHQDEMAGAAAAAAAQQPDNSVKGVGAQARQVLQLYDI